MLFERQSTILIAAASQELDEIDSNISTNSFALVTPSRDIALTTSWINFERFAFPEADAVCAEGKMRAKSVRRDSSARKSDKKLL
jgi:hypothetical protein